MSEKELYKKLYYLMFNGVTDVIEALQKLQQDAEEIYIDTCEDEVEEENNEE